jgi:multidrug efflux pump subunit AcrB
MPLIAERPGGGRPWLIGLLFRELIFTISAAILASMLVAPTW